MSRLLTLLLLYRTGYIVGKYVYDPDEHDGVAFEDLLDAWKCPRCRQPKEKFNQA